ncbi:N-acetylmuramoyl-L-alanine amidase family protein [Nocardioides nitrophenolicus]|uniref:N-acetylmuramoyl-L-alanine amidase family protein n=1 Tax=Nocardioides nitrophenolicus TaxID=60489 RepID=UPI00195A16C6|nr:N-acetylmuramoyl-L-alanine amidase [Nocardioides nitrophenolicus]MBM7516518.1 N-acetylmuramoyl-L-alanine amidase [Nocardioides nitrophenolicus]
MRPWPVVLVCLAALAAGCTTDAPARPTSTPTGSTMASSPPTAEPAPTPPTPRPLAGRVVVLDPGHQLGNARFPAQINRLVDAGGFDKACNTTGTSSDDGYPEATFTWQVATEVRRRLRALGARVLLTRDENSAAAWGPCIDERGRVGNPGEPGPTAELRISLHADGNLASSAHGFHVIRRPVREGETGEPAARAERLARALRDALVAAGFATSTYLGEDGIDVRDDLGTLNLSEVPAVMAELGNMRHPGDAAVMESEAGRRRYARAVVAAVRSYLGA